MDEFEEERARLLSEANKLLVGSDKMMRLISNALEFGSSSITDQSYSVKARVKTPQSLVDKVLRKRRAGDTDYSLSSVTDIVGVRFLVLFKQDLTSLVSAFAEFLSKFHAEPTSLLFGDNLRDGIREVIVYKTAVAEESYLSIFSQLNSFFKGHGFPDGFVRIETKDTKYSSVHIVANGLVYVGGQAKSVPVEFQLRTVFEDIWSEVEHRLIYKNSRLQEVSGSSVREMRFGQALMDSLKNQLDVGSEAADRAYFELLFESAVESTKSTAASRALFVLDSIHELLPSDAQDAIVALRDEIVETYGVLASLESPEEFALAARKFLKMRNSIEAFETDWRDKCVQTEHDKNRFRYMIDMEIAASYYWQGQLASRRIGVEILDMDENPSKDAREFFEKARGIYFDIASLPDFTNDPVLHLRIGEIFRNMRQLKPAQVHFETAYNSMGRDGWVGKNSIFESIIPRQLGYLYWLQSMELSQAYAGAPNGDGAVTGNAARAITSQVLAKIAKAFGATFGLDLLTFDRLDPGTSDPEREKAIAYNNAMSYALEYLEKGGERGVLNEISDNGFEIDFYDRFYTYYAPGGTDKIDIRIVETGLSAALVFDDVDRGLAWLKRAEDWLSERPEGKSSDVLYRRVDRAVNRALSVWKTKS